MVEQTETDASLADFKMEDDIAALPGEVIR